MAKLNQAFLESKLRHFLWASLLLFSLVVTGFMNFSGFQGVGNLAGSDSFLGNKLPVVSDQETSQMARTLAPNELIRFHVLANSDSDEDQELKRAVRDAILERVSPRLAQSQSLDESRKLLQTVIPEMKTIAEQVIRANGKKDEVQVVYGKFAFPTKSYGSLVLPAGEYEAVRVLIGKAEGANWWCVLFPPLCFVDAQEATTVPVDGKPGIAMKNSNKVSSEESVRPKPRFWIWEQMKKIMAK